MKTITIICPKCGEKIEYGLKKEEMHLLFELLTSDKDFMFKLGQEAAKQYFNAE